MHQLRLVLRDLSFNQPASAGSPSATNFSWWLAKSPHGSTGFSRLLDLVSTVVRDADV
jgi:hypothetical protein